MLLAGCRDADACAPARRLRPHARLPADGVGTAVRRRAPCSTQPRRAGAARRGCCGRRAGCSAWSRRRTPVGAEGIEARVDQVDAALQVNPVAGFVLPDHLDESLEVFGIDGAPHRRAAARGGERRRGVGDRRRPRRPGRCRPAPRPGAGAARAGRLRRRAGGRRRRARAAARRSGERSAARERAVGAAARHRHHAVDGGQLRRAGQRACRRARRPADRGGARAAAAGADAARRRRPVRPGARRRVGARPSRRRSATRSRCASASSRAATTACSASSSTTTTRASASSTR